MRKGLAQDGTAQFERQRNIRRQGLQHRRERQYAFPALFAQVDGISDHRVEIRRIGPLGASIAELRIRQQRRIDAAICATLVPERST